MVPPYILCIGGILKQTQVCNVHQCLETCIVSEWSPFSDCSRQCGTGTKQRTRKVANNARGDGIGCPPLKDVQICNTHECGSDCTVNEWSEFTPCSAGCGGGIQTRERTVASAKTGDGLGCPMLQESRKCNTRPCEQDCELDEWGEFGECSMTDNRCTAKRERAIVKPPLGGGLSCGMIEEHRVCDPVDCKTAEDSTNGRDCEMAPWSSFSPCTQECGGGEQTRTRAMARSPQGEGKPCGPETETRTCNSEPCRYI